MARYSIIDKNDNIVGHVVIIQSETQKQNEMQSVAGGGTLSASGPISEGILFVVVLGSLLIATWTFTGVGWLSATVGIVCTFALAGIRSWRNGSPPATDDNSDVILKGEFKDVDGTIYYDYINNKNIRLNTLERVCEAVQANDFIWMGRPTMRLKTRISRGQYDMIRAEFSRLNYFKDAEGGRKQISARGRLFVRLVAENYKRKRP